MRIQFEADCILDKLNRRHYLLMGSSETISDHDIQNGSFQASFLQRQKQEIFGSQENLKTYCKILRVLGFNSAKKDLKLIKSCLLPSRVNEKANEATVI